MHGYYDAVIQQLRLAGYSWYRQGKGSHEIWTNGLRHQIVSRNISSRHMTNEIMKQAGIAHRF